MSDDNITEFRPKIVGNGAVVDCDQILEENKGAFARVALIGWTKDGKIAVASSHGAPDTLWLIEVGKDFLVHNTGDPW